MANADLASPAPASTRSPSAETSAPVLVSLAPAAADHLPLILRNLAEALTGTSTVVLSPDVDAPDSAIHPSLTLLPLTEPIPHRSSWVLGAYDFQAAFRQAATHNAGAVLLLGPEAHTLAPATIRALVAGITTEAADLAIPDYLLGPREALVNSAMLYPLTRGLFGTAARFPLAVDLALSLRMAERLNLAAARPIAANDTTALVWPVSEAAVANFRITDVPGGPRTLPTPDVEDLNTLLAAITGSFFTDIEAKATTWQRSRPAQPAGPFITSPAAAHEPAEVQPLIDNFRVAYTNLHEIWSLVLPPQSLLGLKKLSLLPTGTFRLPPTLWARIVYDFVLAFRLRTLNRGHLLGALTPLYLAWVASHLLSLDSGEPAGQHTEATALAFESEKPYFVSRWRWPDRFNP